MTADESDSLADDADSLADGTTSATDDPGASDPDATGSDSVDPDAADPDATGSDSVDPDAADRIEALEATVESLADRLSQLERNVAWTARQQARETGNGACPECNTGGALRVERTPTGKKRVRCSQCGEQFD